MFYFLDTGYEVASGFHSDEHAQMLVDEWRYEIASIISEGKAPTPNQPIRIDFTNDMGVGSNAKRGSRNLMRNALIGGILIAGDSVFDAKDSVVRLQSPNVLIISTEAFEKLRSGGISLANLKAQKLIDFKGNDVVLIQYVKFFKEAGFFK